MTDTIQPRHGHTRQTWHTRRTKSPRGQFAEEAMRPSAAAQPPCSNHTPPPGRPAASRDDALTGVQRPHRPAPRGHFLVPSHHTPSGHACSMRSAVYDFVSTELTRTWGRSTRVLSLFVASRGRVRGLCLHRRRCWCGYLRPAPASGAHGRACAGVAGCTAAAKAAKSARAMASRAAATNACMWWTLWASSSAHPSISFVSSR